MSRACQASVPQQQPARPSVKVGSACIKVFSLYSIPEELVQSDGRHELIELVLHPTARYYYRDQRVTLLDFPEKVISFEKSAVVKQNNRNIMEFTVNSASSAVHCGDNRSRQDNNTSNSINNKANDEAMSNGVEGNLSEANSSHHAVSRSGATVRKSVPTATRTSSLNKRRKESHLRTSCGGRCSNSNTNNSSNNTINSNNSNNNNISTSSISQSNRPGWELHDLTEAPLIGATRPPAAMGNFILSPSSDPFYSYHSAEGSGLSGRSLNDPSRPWTLLPKRQQPLQQLCDVADVQPRYENEFVIHFPTRVDLKVVIEVLVGVRLRRPCSTSSRWVTSSLDRVGANRDKIGSFAAAEGELLRHKIANRTVGLTVGYLSCRLSLPHVEMDLRACGCDAEARMAAALERLLRDDARLRAESASRGAGGGATCSSAGCGSSAKSDNNSSVHGNNSQSHSPSQRVCTSTQPTCTLAGSAAQTVAQGSNVCQSMARLSVLATSNNTNSTVSSSHCGAPSEDKLIACDSQSTNTVNTASTTHARAKTVTALTLMTSQGGAQNSSSAGISSSESCHSRSSSSHTTHNLRSDIYHRLLMGESELSVYYSLLDRYDPDFFLRRVRCVQNMYHPSESEVSWVSTPAEELLADAAHGLSGYDLLQRLCVELGPEYAHISPRTRRMLFRWFYRLTDADIATVEQKYFDGDVDTLDHEPDLYMQTLCTHFGHQMEPMHYNFPKLGYTPDLGVYFLDTLVYVSVQWREGAELIKESRKHDSSSSCHNNIYAGDAAHSSNSNNNSCSSSPTTHYSTQAGDAKVSAAIGASTRAPRPMLVLTSKEQPLRLPTNAQGNANQSHEIGLLIEKYRAEFNQIIPCIAHSIESVLTFNESPERLARRGRSLATEEPFALFLSDAPCYSYTCLLRGLANYTYLSPSSLLTAMIYLDRLCQSYPGFYLSRYNIGKLLVVSARVANKVIDLRSVNNLCFAYTFSLDLADMNKMEERFLKLMAFDLFISPAEFNAYANMIQPPGTHTYTQTMRNN